MTDADTLTRDECAAQFETVRFPVPFLTEMGKADTIAELLNIISRWVGHIIPSARCSIALLDDLNGDHETGTVRVFALTGNDAVPVGQPLPVSRSNPGRAILTKAPVLITDIENNDAIEAPMLLKGGLRCCVSAPLMSGDRCFGAVNIANSEPNSYTAKDCDTLAGIGSWIATHLRNVHHVEELLERTRTDFLTGVLNRQAFTDVSSKMFEQWRRGDAQWALAMIDIDHFKSINDRFGHQAGDFVLVEVAGRLADRLRAADVFARLGGEEFGLLLSGVDLKTAARVAEDCRSVIADEPFQINGEHLPVTISIGLTQPASEDQSFDHTLNRADKALYKSKAAGRDRVVTG